MEGCLECNSSNVNSKIFFHLIIKKWCLTCEGFKYYDSKNLICSPTCPLTFWANQKTFKCEHCTENCDKCTSEKNYSCLEW